MAAILKLTICRYNTNMQITVSILDVLQLSIKKAHLHLAMPDVQPVCLNMQIMAAILNIETTIDTITY